MEFLQLFFQFHVSPIGPIIHTRAVMLTSYLFECAVPTEEPELAGDWAGEPRAELSLNRTRAVRGEERALQPSSGTGDTGGMMRRSTYKQCNLSTDKSFVMNSFIFDFNLRRSLHIYRHNTRRRIKI